MNVSEGATFAIIAAAMLGLAVFGLHHKREAEDARVMLAAAEGRLRLCSESISAMQTEAKAREAAAQKALAAAQSAAKSHAQRADRLLRAPAAVPGDDCASARVRARKWLEGRQ